MVVCKYHKSFYLLSAFTLINFIVINVWIIHQREKSNTGCQTTKLIQDIELDSLFKNLASLNRNQSFFQPISTNLLNFVNNDQHLLWFMANGTLRPDSNNKLFSQLAIWPDQVPDTSDRIVNQLMYIPFNYNKQEQIRKGKYKKILLASDPLLYEPDLSRQKFQECPVSTCELISDQKQADLADAIIFKGVNKLHHYKRLINQIWIIYLLESPFHVANLSDGDGLINWTATYRHDSDIVDPYEKFVLYNENVKVTHQVKDYSLGKTKKVAWFVSNCWARNRRLSYAKELARHIEVDIYGACGDKTCSKIKGNNCFQMLERDYKFYLAFENSNCKDYITEKFFNNALRHNTIPIVLGANIQDYQRSSPFNSYIHVNDFESPKSLADYLKILDTHSNLYNSYFQWKNTGEFVNTFFWCRLCAMLHAPIKPKAYEKLQDWWNGDHVCAL